MTEPVIHDRVTTTSEQGKRVRINPITVSGKWKNRRVLFQWSLLVLYVLVPWIKINGHPILLLDVVHRRFSIFGKLFFAHEAPYLLLIALSFFMWIGLITALFGRVWCGWACPQTVFIESLFRKIEVFLEGDLGTKRNSFRTVLKWSIFAGISILLSHSFLGYFVGSEASFKMMTTAPSSNWGAFLMVFGFTGIVLFDFGWFREQFCLIACPYGRFQSVMMDRASLYVAYDEKRGDCIDCFKCVRACPTGIDIRNGLQFECIACTACMDACDSIMRKIKKPEKLISYQSEITLEKKQNPWIRMRTIAYAFFLIIFAGTLGLLLKNRTLNQEEFTRAVGAPYDVVTMADGSSLVINHFKVRFYNLDWENAAVHLSLSPESAAKGIELAQGGQSLAEINVGSGQSSESQFFIKVPRGFFEHNPSPKVSLSVHWNGAHSETHMQEVKLIGPIINI